MPLETLSTSLRGWVEELVHWFDVVEQSSKLLSE